MDFGLIRRLTWDKVNERATYTLALFVGTLINVYGQIVVPWMRGAQDPLAVLPQEFGDRPVLTGLSVLLGYVFPFCVGTYSSVATRYKNRRVESIADFPERKPDPVFRAAKSGRLVEIGATTQVMFDQHRIASAQDMVGEAMWAEIVNRAGPGSGLRVHFTPENTWYIISHAPTPNDEINVYLTRISHEHMEEMSA